MSGLAGLLLVALVGSVACADPPSEPPDPEPDPVATRLGFDVRPANTSPGGAIPEFLVFARQGSAPGFVGTFAGNITMTIASNPGGGTLSGTTTVAAIGGYARFSDLRIDQVGIGYTLTASASGLESGTTGAFDICNHCWTFRRPMPTGRALLGVGVVNGVLYAIGGLGGPELSRVGPTAVVEVYDPAGNSWTTRASLFVPRYAAGVGVVSGVLYAVGGVTDPFTTTAAVEAYDPATNVWTARAPMLSPRAGIGIGEVNGILYAAGGSSGNDSLGTLEAYDPATNTWSTRRGMSQIQGGVAVATLNGILYAVRGTKLEAYDPATDSWTTRAPLPTRRSSIAAAGLNGRLYIVGVEESGPFQATVAAYDPATNTWSSEPPLQSPRNGIALGVVNGVLYALGSWTSVEAYDPTQPTPAR